MKFSQAYSDYGTCLNLYLALYE
ncbi:hypothetical protein CA267_018440 [Alteromonas pelagimontana]|uniref:Tetratricopeptide SHNi-TPR domain-containing protein n=1 Tax=Alteromonas pelagimontana TaxID=1858656 RepID=A0A6M4MK32_9ALTE|nr:hypothetical protein CA267_018440 [Alteromonas pelagimontana]